MTSATNTTRNLIAAVALVAAGVAGTMLWQRAFTAPTLPKADANGTAPAPRAAEAPTTVTLSADLLKRAGVRTETVRGGSATSAWRAPGNVEADAYRQTIVTPIAGGRVTAVMAELGQNVTEGQTLVEIYSPELAEAERGYLTARADLDLANQRRLRAEKLGAIGAVSQQEVDDTRAEYRRQTNTVEGERAKLRLLGLAPETITALASSADIAAVIHVPAPSAGVVIKRAVNRGQNVDATMELLTIADLSTVWVIADVYERDMARVRIGSTATVTSAALPGESWTGRVAYLDPQVAADTRTLKARIEVANPKRALKPGMLMDVAMSNVSAAETVVMPRTAAQQIGGRTVVFIPDAGKAGTFEAREVQLGAIAGDSVEVRDGVSAGDTVVTDGAFALKAEWERIGGRLPPPVAAANDAATPSATMTVPMTAQRVTLEVTEAGFVPERIQVEAGRPIELVVTRTTDNTCGTEIVIGNGRQRADLPLNKAVTLKLAAMNKGELKISCGMAMLKGAVVAK